MRSIPGGRSPLLARDHELDGEPGTPRARQEVIDTGETRLRHERHLALAGLQDSEQAAQLGERVPTSLLDGGHGLHGTPRILVEENAGGPGLHGHERDRMGDHVVQLTGDPAPFLCDRRALRPLALALEAGRPLLELRGVLRSLL